MKTVICFSLILALAICRSTVSLCMNEKPTDFYLYNKQPDNAANAKVYIAYPRVKEDKKFFVYFNIKKVGALNYGERLLYNTTFEGMLKVTISNKDTYTEPSTLSRNTRTVNIKEGKEYYFEINGKGELEYIINTEKGKSRFSDDGSYVESPKTLTENNAD